MARRIPLNERPALFRDPADWARDTGWVSRRRALNIAAKLDNLATIIEETDGDKGSAGEMWAKYLRDIIKEIAPKQTPMERKLTAERKVEAMREP